MISDATKIKIIGNNQKVAELLKENERLIKSEGADIFGENCMLERTEKIQIPSGYVRTNEKFIADYRLWEIIKDQNVKKNVAYSLQLADFYNFLMSRFNIWGSVETMFIKSAVINLVAIVEEVVWQCANNICCNPDKCGQTQNCERHFSSKQRERTFEALSRMRELEIIDYDERKMQKIREIVGYRNRVHIRLATENEFRSSDFTIELYNEVMELLVDLIEKICTNGTSMYLLCD